MSLRPRLKIRLSEPSLKSQPLACATCSSLTAPLPPNHLLPCSSTAAPLPAAIAPSCMLWVASPSDQAAASLYPQCRAHSACVSDDELHSIAPFHHCLICSHCQQQLSWLESQLWLVRQVFGTFSASSSPSVHGASITSQKALSITGHQVTLAKSP
jgi:hypothetical protein